MNHINGQEIIYWVRGIRVKSVMNCRLWTQFQKFKTFNGLD